MTRRGARRRWLAPVALLTGAGAAVVGAGPAPVARAGSTCLGAPITITGSEGPDVIQGTGGPDVIHGQGGNDVIHGGGGDDRLCGGAGQDNLQGGSGFDRCDGGADRDAAADCESESSIP